ncbi:MAG: hypothetical protein ACI3VB_00515 [Oscillospiraceae bacterium]
MLALLEAEPIYGRRRRCFETFGAESAAGINCLRLTLHVPDRLGERNLERCIERSAGQLKAMRVRQLVFRKDFPYRERFLELGFTECGHDAPLRATAGDIICRAAKNHGSAFLYAPRPTQDVCRALRKLCGGFRYLTAYVPEGQTQLMEIAEEYGISLTALRRDGEAPSDAAVFFGSPRRLITLPGGCAVLFADGKRGDMIYGGREISRIVFRVPERFRDELPAGFPEMQLISAALYGGKLSPEDIKIDSADMYA